MERPSPHIVVERPEVARMNRFEAIPALTRPAWRCHHPSRLLPNQVGSGKGDPIMLARLYTTVLERFISRFARVAAIVIVAIMLTASAHGQHGNAVTFWNTVAHDAFAPTEGTNPMVQSRTLAVFHAAIHDAVNAIDPRFEPYTPGLPLTPQA